MFVVLGFSHHHRLLNLMTSDMPHTEDVLMSEQDGVVDLSLSEPGLLVSGGEDFDSDTLSLPLPPPHFTVTTLTWQTKAWKKKKLADRKVLRRKLYMGVVITSKMND